MFAKWQGGARQAHIFGAHDLERLGIFQHAVLVDTRFVCKGVFTNDGFVELNWKASNCCNAARDIHQFGCVDARLVRHDVIAYLHGHNDLFQRCIACAFAKAVDGAFDLTCTCFNRGQAVGRRHA